MPKKLIKRIIGKFGYQITKKVPGKNHKPTPSIFTMERALGRMTTRGLDITTVIDVGASDGRWSRKCMRFFPDASYLLVEAQPGHLQGLEKFKADFAKGDFVLAVAGEDDGTIYFNDSELFGGQASVKKEGVQMKEFPQVSLDNEITRKGLLGPFLLKLDTHGFEVPILEGAREVLRNTELLIIETYNFKLTEHSLRYWEMCQYLDKLGFAPIENVDLMLRQKDKSFWQMDTFFVPKNNPVFQYNKYE